MYSILTRQKFAPWQICIRWNSILYVTGDKASKQVSVIVPYLDFDRRFESIPKLIENVQARKLDVNVQKLNTLWQSLKHVLNEKKILENRRLEIVDKMKEFQIENRKEEAEKCRVQGRLLRDDLKALMKTIWALEESTVVKALKLPNDLHPDTPLEEPSVIFEYGESKSEKCDKNHLEIGRQFAVLDFRNPTCYYLEGAAAEYELNLLQYFSEIFKNNEFTEMSGSDLVRSVILEGCGISFEDPNSVFILQNTEDTENRNRLHLVGSSSLPAFCSFFTKHLIPANAFPLKYVALGRQYEPVSTPKLGGLFDVSQASIVGIFAATCKEKDMIAEFKRLVELYIDIYKDVSSHFRVVYVPAFQLNMWESLRASIQMYSPHLGLYVEVGSLSLSGSYISKRLLMAAEGHPEDKDNFIHIISGTALSVPRFLACTIENNFVSGKELIIPRNVSRDLNFVYIDYEDPQICKC